MKIAIDISPLQTGHKVRGVGFYLSHLKNALVTYFPEHEYIFFENKEQINQKIDLIHYPYFEPFFITLPFFEQYKKVITVHDLTPLVFPDHFPAGIRGNFAWQIQRFNLKRSDGIITDSDSSTKDVYKYTGVSTKKIHTVHLAAGEEFIRLTNHESRIKDVRKKYSLPEKFVLYVGDVTWNKNLPQLVEAMKELKLPLVMVGKSLVQTDFDRTNPWNKDLITVQKETEGESNFIKLGFVPTDDLVALYNAATVFVFPSVYEGFGLPVLEAMQSGCPVVTTKGGSLAEVAGDAAYFVDGYDTKSIEKGIAGVFESKRLQDSLREKGFAQAKKFSWKQTAKQTIEAYKNCLSQ